ncbi:MAG: dephospho-CoA kinase [Caldilineaceae bacterium]|nr:dephospho-CoA kinase [Caldilineaceae bacterium]MCY4091715.1 dephospho-CoA kinase [Caldilineaceae bacterium]MCY4116820.1 dephospho-CoA kinase [Caldilineaceae bacterium]MDE0071165.1 dephospho-CoA kinase [Caldilineaceae bacterium]MDE0180506.1 dephospho-CoA kinase [Caldilineaceae bacterium]
MARRSLVIGLTGNIATGKSTILNYLIEKCATIIDADKLGHRVIEPGGPAYDAVVRAFGKGILREDGTIDRKKLGKIVFSNPLDLGRLEKIVHPKIFELGKQEIADNDSPVIILEAIKLLEAGLMSTLCDEIWVVTSSFATQFRRLLEMRKMEETDARRMIDLQPPQAAKVNQADRVIDNDGTLTELHAQLDAIWDDLKRRYPRRMTTLAR